MSVFVHMHMNKSACICLGVSGPYEAPQYFPPLKSNHAAVCKKSRDDINVDRSCLVKGLCPNVRLDIYFPGFPTLKHIPHTVSFQAIYGIMFVHSRVPNDE